KLVSPSSEAKTAPPIRAAPHKPVRIVPQNHWTERRRQPIRQHWPPSKESGGTLPRLIASASNLRFAPRSFAWSKTTVPCTRDRTLLSRFRSSPFQTAHPRADF